MPRLLRNDWTPDNDFLGSSLRFERLNFDLEPPLVEKKYLSGYGSAPTPRREDDLQLPFVCGDPPFAVTRKLTSRAGWI